MPDQCPSCKQLLLEPVPNCPSCGASTAGSKPNVPGYTLEAALPLERWGSVWKANRSRDGLAVELHLIQPSKTADLDPLVEKIRALVPLKHPRVTATIAAGRTDEAGYYLLEPGSGATLAQTLQKTPRLSERNCLKLGLSLAQGLEALEKHGTRHGRIRPQDVRMSADGTGRLYNAGITELFRASRPELFQNLEDISFSSPEELQGESAGISSDQYALGVLLHLCMTGRRPHEAKDVKALKAKVSAIPIKAPGGATPGFAHLLMRLTAKSPGDRFPSASDVIREFTRIAAQPTKRRAAPRAAPKAAAPQAETPPEEEKKSNPPIMIGSIVGVVVLVLAVVLFGMLGSSDEEKPPEPPPKAGPPDKQPDNQKKVAEARQALTAFRKNRMDPAIRAGEFAAVAGAIEEFGGHYPEIPTEVRNLRDELQRRATSDVDRLTREANDRRRKGKAMQAAESLRGERYRFEGVFGLEKQLDVLISQLDAAATSESKLYGMALDLMKEAKELYRLGDSQNSVKILQNAGFKAEEARIKFIALQDVVPAEQAQEIKNNLREVGQLQKLIKDRLKSAGN